MSNSISTAKTVRTNLIWGWLIAISTLVWGIVNPISRYELPPWCIVAEIVTYVFLLAMDIWDVKDKGYKLGPWVIAGAFLPPLYMFLRAYSSDKSYKPAVTFTIICVVRIIIFFGAIIWGLGILPGAVNL